MKLISIHKTNNDPLILRVEFEEQYFYTKRIYNKLIYRKNDGWYFLDSSQSDSFNFWDSFSENIDVILPILKEYNIGEIYKFD